MLINGPALVVLVLVAVLAAAAGFVVGRAYGIRRGTREAVELIDVLQVVGVGPGDQQRSEQLTPTVH